MQHYNQGYDELYHTGVMGMKWGKRKSGSKTADGKSQHRQKLETKYKNKGLSEQEATKKVNNIYVGRAVVGAVAGATVINIVRNKIMVDAGRKITSRVMDYLNDMPLQDIDWTSDQFTKFKTDYVDRLG